LSQFEYFTKIIPHEIYSRTKSYISKHIIIFEPDDYVTGQVLKSLDFTFILFLDDSPTTKINGREFIFKKGSLLFISPHTEVYTTAPPHERRGKYISVTINKDYFINIASQISGEGLSLSYIVNRYSQQLLDIIGNFQRELMDYGDKYPLMIDSLSNILVIQLIRDIITDKNMGSKNNGYINKAIEIMHNSYSHNISINDICNSIYLSPCHFKRIFKEYTGKTPYQYLLNIRLEKAKELLRLRECSVEEIARLCGFVNSGHFSTVFKRVVKLSPSAYRKVCK